MRNKLFGTDGIRGTANIYPMTVNTTLRLGQTLGSLLCADKKRVAVARDTRLSGEMLESALIAGLTSVGIDVVCLGVVPTPLLTFATPSLNVDASVMITASHNPYQDNGLKIIGADGNKLSDTETAQIEQILCSDTSIETSPSKIGRIESDRTAVDRYIRQALHLVPDENAFKGLRIVLDCANGAFSEILPHVFKTLGAGVLTLSNTPDGKNINLNCGSQHTENMQQTVIDSHADLGIAVDGDGDRIIICDEKGKRIDGDQIIAFLATCLKNDNQLKGGAAVATIWSNLGLEKYLKTQGIKLFRTPVGERYVIEKMREIGSNIGGEESGHMVLSDYAKTGDALLTALVVTLGLIKSGQKMSEIFPIFEKCPCLITSVRFETMNQALEALQNENLQNEIRLAQEKIRLNGSIIVRKSGTEPVLKLRVEGEDEDLVGQISRHLSETIEKLK